MSDLAIRVDNLGKRYRIGEIQKIVHEASYSVFNKITFPFAYLITTLRKPRPDEILWAVKDVSFEVEQGEVIGIIGLNGAGKSTLCKLLSRITQPTTGRAEIYGRIAALLEIGTGFHPDLSGRENTYINGYMMGMNKKEIDTRFDEIVAFAEIEKMIDTPVKRYSSGMYVRLAFSVAAHLMADIMIIDEVLAVGDFSFQNKCLGKMDDAAKGGRTVLFVSHNMASINRLCPRTILLKNGLIDGDGPTAKIITRYLSEGAVGTSYYTQDHNSEKPMNLLEAKVLNEQGEIASNIDYNKSVSIEISYEINRPVSGCYVGFELLTMSGVYVLTTADHDTKMELLGDRETGVYQARVVIPGQLLSPGEYIIRIFVADGFRTHAYDRVDALRFTVTDTGAPGSQLGNDSRLSILQPMYDWETVRIEK